VLVSAAVDYQTVSPVSYQLEIRRSAGDSDGAICLEQGAKVAALLVLAEGHSSDLLARGEACVLCVVNVATGQTVARRPVWPAGGARPGEGEDAWWRADAEAFLTH
jgi:hypothetical protein